MDSFPCMAHVYRKELCAMYISPAQVFSFQAKFSVSAPYVCISAFFPHPSPQPTHSPPFAAATICSALSRSSRSYQVNHRAASLPLPSAHMDPAKHSLSSISPHPTPKNRRLSISTYHRELEEVDVVADSHLPAALASSAHQIAVHSFLVPPYLLCQVGVYKPACMCLSSSAAFWNRHRALKQ